MLRIHVLGGLYVTSDGRQLTGAAGQPRLLALLAMLAVAGERGMTRDTILAYLWPDYDPERGDRALTQALSDLRRDLGSDEAVMGMKDLRLNPDVVASDMADFRDSSSTGDYDRAMGVWRGAFLHGFQLPGASAFGIWVEDQRAVLEHEYAALRDQLGEADPGSPQVGARPIQPSAAISAAPPDDVAMPRAPATAHDEAALPPRESAVGPRRVVRLVGVVVAVIILLTGYAVWRALLAWLR